MTDKTIIKNAHCKFFEGQTGLCNAKEFTKCNPVNCKLYTIDELSTILELQDKLKHKEQECKELKREMAFGNNGKLSDKIRAIVFKNLNYENSKYKQALDEIEEFIKSQLDDFGNDVYSMDKSAINNIQDIINKVKE